MMTIKALTEYCDDLLQSKDITDPYCANGLQVHGKEEVHKVACAVTASKEVIERAAEWGADVLLVHHGILWGKGTRTIDALMQARLQPLMSNNISLLSYHLPLDAHPEIGNNAQIATALGCSSWEMQGISAVANLPEPLAFGDFVALCSEVIQNAPILAESNGNDMVSKIAICSGGAGSYAPEFIGNVDAFITGEVSLSEYYPFREGGLALVAAGHHATERFGIRALQEALADEFDDLELQFFDEECPV